MGQQFPPIATLADIEAIETVPLAERLDVDKTHGLLASVRLDDPAHRGDAEGVLGGFAVKSQIA